MKIGTTVRVMKCKQCPRLVGQVGKIVAGIDRMSPPAPTMCIVEFCDGYKRVIKKSWLEVSE